ncbi:hypothetical protein QTG56_22335 (plasmid) [Rossellomorea sp. AcN35-11]|nr:hypothetical protein [Rossellomorea aquimaris]WJV32114.1 hypothetical protein QTG56_22335 [Rossellomorea sp. AcN35-11]
MGKSKAKKKRIKMQREQKRNPELSRGIYTFADMRTRTTKTKKDKLYQNKHKGRLLDQGTKRSTNRPFLSFYICFFTVSIRS